MGTWVLGFAAVLVRTREATPGADAGRWMQMLAAGFGSAVWLGMALVGLLLEEERSPPPVGGQIKRAGKDQCRHSEYLSTGQQQHWSSKAASSGPQCPIGSPRVPAPQESLPPAPRGHQVLCSPNLPVSFALGPKTPDFIHTLLVSAPHLKQQCLLLGQRCKRSW